MFSFIFGKSSTSTSSPAPATSSPSPSSIPFSSYSSSSSSPNDPQSTSSADAAGPLLPRSVSLRSQRSRAATSATTVTMATTASGSAANAEVLPLEKSLASYLKKIRVKEEEIRSKLRTICNLKQQLSCLRPTPTKPSAPEVPAFAPFEVPDLRALPIDEAVEEFNKTIEACIFKIQDLTKKSSELQLEIDRLGRDLQGCRIRSRTYNAMIAKGAEIPEYTAFLQQNQRPT